jgi:HEAT repeat protein
VAREAREEQDLAARRVAIAFLGSSGNREVVDVLIRALLEDPLPQPPSSICCKVPGNVRVEAARSLGRLIEATGGASGASMVEPLSRAISAPGQLLDVRLAAVETLALIDSSQAHAALVEVALAGPPRLATSAVQGLAAAEDPGASLSLRRILLGAAPVPLRLAAFEALEARAQPAAEVLVRSAHWSGRSFKKS